MQSGRIPSSSGASARTPGQLPPGSGNQGAAGAGQSPSLRTARRHNGNGASFLPRLPSPLDNVLGPRGRGPERGPAPHEQLAQHLEVSEQLAQRHDKDMRDALQGLQDNPPDPPAAPSHARTSAQGPGGNGNEEQSHSDASARHHAGPADGAQGRGRQRRSEQFTAMGRAGHDTRRRQAGISHLTDNQIADRRHEMDAAANAARRLARQQGKSDADVTLDARAASDEAHQNFLLRHPPPPGS
jgi:hypothetical protein